MQQAGKPTPTFQHWLALKKHRLPKKLRSWRKDLRLTFTMFQPLLDARWSENEPQRESNIPGVAIGRGNLAKVSVADHVIGQSEIRVVGKIEEFAAELQACLLTEWEIF